ncbi:MAG: hypothetical protein JO222_04725, partial [Frankiales bacterium]|nr:hypothetical protein [Frankiales bacterium]
ATAGQPFRPEHGELLSAVADLLALTLPATGPVTDAGRAILDAEADRADVAAALRETVGGALATVRYAAEQLADGRADAAALDDPLRAAAAAVDAVRGEARAYALDAGLRVALRELARRGDGDRPDDGRPDLRVSVTADDPVLDSLPPAVAVAVERVAAAALRNATGRAAVVATYDEEWVKLSVESAEIGYDASELDRWARRASALGGVLRLRLDGVDLELPAPAR